MPTKTSSKAAPKKSAKKTTPKKTTTKSKTKKPVASNSDPKAERFAHPFFNKKPSQKTVKVDGTNTKMTGLVNYIATKLEQIPPLKVDPPIMTLDQIIGAQNASQIKTNKSISFHAVGDTGHENGLPQQLVADAMTLDYDVQHPEKSPAFFFHLGDVIYYNNTDQGYFSQFYVPYKKYPGKVIAIPGNHDGEMFKFNGASTGQLSSCGAFQENFCLPAPSVPPAAGSIYREMVNQPGVYWILNAPFVDIIGLYSNVAEGPGFISSPDIGTSQKDWLIKTLKGIKSARGSGSRKALVIGVHHPPFSSGGHSSSTQMLADMDEACNQAGIMPDVVLAAHSHNYQRYTRSLKFGGKDIQVPYIVAGMGGRGIGPVKAGDGSVVTDPIGSHTFNNSFVGYGYLTVTVDKNKLSVDVIQVDHLDGTKKPYETINVDLNTNVMTIG